VVLKGRRGDVDAPEGIIDAAPEDRCRAVFGNQRSTLTLPGGVRYYGVRVWDLEVNGPVPRTPGAKEPRHAKQQLDKSLVAERDAFACALLAELGIASQDYAKRRQEFWTISRQHGHRLPAKSKTTEETKIRALFDALRRVTEF
jgi:hypothetical protein